jgi:2-oxo-4-hydroxy-4-carboxy-5-ureidoimidazoline decarboxylase
MQLIDLNACDRTTFVATLGGIFEHSPWVAEQACTRRPFESVDALHDAMMRGVREAPDARNSPSRAPGTRGQGSSAWRAHGRIDP